ncbi:hypothetical protein ABK040_004178 [Willaertia magna]
MNPSDHILNKQHSNISIKQKPKQQQQINNNNLNDNHFTNMTTQQQLNNNTGSIDSQPLQQQLNNTIVMNKLQENKINKIQQSIPSIYGFNGSILIDSKNEMILNKITKYSHLNNFINLKIGNYKQLEMEIKKNGNEIICLNSILIFNNLQQTNTLQQNTLNNNLQQNNCICFRIKSSILDKPLMYIPITGNITLQLNIPNLNILNLENNEMKYDLRWTIDLLNNNTNINDNNLDKNIILPIRYNNVGVLVLKLVKLEYVEFIALREIEFHLMTV